MKTPTTTISYEHHLGEILAFRDHIILRAENTSKSKPRHLIMNEEPQNISENNRQKVQKTGFKTRKVVKMTISKGLSFDSRDQL